MESYIHLYYCDLTGPSRKLLVMCIAERGRERVRIELN